MKRMINKELVPVLKDKEIDYWLLTYVKDRLYYEFSGNGGEDIPWDKIEAELKDKVEDPLEYITGNIYTIEDMYNTTHKYNAIHNKYYIVLEDGTSIEYNTLDTFIFSAKWLNN